MVDTECLSALVPPDNGYSIYMWRNASWDVPLGVGEFDMAHPWDKEWSPKRALMIRGFRYCDFFDIRPFWIYESTYPEKIRYWFRSSMSPVAVFDKAYDDQKLVEGPDGYFEPPPPVYEEGSPISRTLVIYNDEFFGERTGGKMASYGRRQYYCFGELHQ